MTQAVTHHPEHETSPWPLLTGMGVLLSALALLAYFPWRMPLLGVVLGGAMLALLAVGLAGWAREFFTHGTEAGLGPVAVAVFIVSEVMIFGTMFAAFWLGRIDHAEQWASFIPANLDLKLALWLTVILWASSATTVLAERAFERGHLAAGGFRLGANIYATTFYGLTGVHTSHVVVGLAIQLLLFGVLASGLMQQGRATFFRGASLYWHFVDIMWIMVALNAYVIGGTR